MKVKCFYLFLFSFWCFQEAELWGQEIALPSKPQKEVFLGKIGSHSIQQFVQTPSGQIAAVGTTTRGTGGGSDLYFALLDSKLNLLESFNLGRRGDEAGLLLTNRPEGGYLVGGYSKANKHNGRMNQLYTGDKDAWLLWLDDQGKTESELLLGSTGPDEFVYANPQVDGSYLLVGNTQDQGWVVNLSPQKKVNWEFKWKAQRSLQQVPTRFITATQRPNGDLYVLGEVLIQDDPMMYLASFSGQGALNWDRTFPLEEAKQGAKIIALDKKRIRIIGSVADTPQRTDGFMMTLNHLGETLDYQKIGGREPDQLLDIQLDAFGNTLLLGQSQSFQRGARRPRAWLVSIDATGNVVAERYWGSKASDIGLTLLPLDEKKWIGGGYTNRKIFSATKAWAWSFTNKTRKSRSWSQATKIKVLKDTLVYHNGHHIDPDNGAFIGYLIQTPEKVGIPDLKAEFTSENLPYFFQKQAFKFGPTPPNSTKWIYVPLVIRDTILPAQLVLNVHLQQGDSVIATFNYPNISIQSEQPPKLKMDWINVTNSLSTQLHLSLVNEGQAKAKKLNLFVVSETCPDFKLALPQDYLEGGDTLSLTYSLEELQGCFASNDPIRLRVVDHTLLNSSSIIIPREAIQQAPVITKAPTPQKDFLKVNWRAPKHELGNKLVINEPEILVQVEVSSSHQLAKADFDIYHNEELYYDGTKMDEVKLDQIGQSTIFQRRIQLVTGDNRLVARIKHDIGTVFTDTLTVRYVARKPSLHILSIGVPSYDLKYTTKDAMEFAQAIQQLANQDTNYHRIFVDTLVDPGQTTKTAILKTMRRLQYRYADRQIQSQDLLVLFISSHGVSADQEHFRIAASDFDNPFLLETSIDFETEIVNYLRGMDCKKLFFVDACHSGVLGSSGLFPEQTESSSLTKWLEGESGKLDLILSCQAEEYSYEDELWQNGAFTEALIRAFNSFLSDDPSSPDFNQNGGLELEELYRFISKEVPNLILQKKPKPQTLQTPLLYRSSSDQPFTLFLQEK